MSWQSDGMKARSGFRQEFPDTEGFCARYMKLRELFYTDESRDIRYPLTIFDILVEGMLDVFLGRRGMTLYTDADNCARAYISIKKQIDADKEASGGGIGSGWFQRRFLCQDRT